MRIIANKRELQHAFREIISIIQQFGDWSLGILQKKKNQLCTTVLLLTCTTFRNLCGAEGVQDHGRRRQRSLRSRWHTVVNQRVASRNSTCGKRVRKWWTSHTQTHTVRVHKLANNYLWKRKLHKCWLAGWLAATFGGMMFAFGTCYLCCALQNDDLDRNHDVRMGRKTMVM